MRAGEIGTVGDQACQVGPVDVAHGDVEQAVDLAEVVERHDVCVVDRGGVAGLVDEPLAELRILGEVLGDDLEGDLAAEADVGGAVHHAHAALAEHPVDPVVPEASPGEILRHAPEPNVLPARLASGSHYLLGLSGLTPGREVRFSVPAHR